MGCVSLQVAHRLLAHPAGGKLFPALMGQTGCTISCTPPEKGIVKSCCAGSWQPDKGMESSKTSKVHAYHPSHTTVYTVYGAEAKAHAQWIEDDLESWQMPPGVGVPYEEEVESLDQDRFRINIVRTQGDKLGIATAIISGSQEYLRIPFNMEALSVETVAGAGLIQQWNDVHPNSVVCP